MNIILHTTHLIQPEHIERSSSCWLNHHSQELGVDSTEVTVMCILCYLQAFVALLLLVSAPKHVPELRAPHTERHLWGNKEKKLLHECHITSFSHGDTLLGLLSSKCLLGGEVLLFDGVIWEYSLLAILLYQANDQELTITWNNMYVKFFSSREHYQQFKAGQFWSILFSVTIITHYIFLNLFAYIRGLCKDNSYQVSSSYNI